MDSLASLNYKELIVMGDFNSNWTHSISDDFKLLCDSRNLFQLVDTPTFHISICRIVRRGGGVAALFKDVYQCKQVSFGQ